MKIELPDEVVSAIVAEELLWSAENACLSDKERERFAECAKYFMTYDECVQYFGQEEADEYFR